MADIEKKVKITVSDNGQLKKTTKQVDNLNKAIDRNDKATRKASKSAQTHDRNMKGVSQMSSNASKNFSKQAQGMQGILVPAYAEVAARVFALTAAYGALQRAADFSILLQGQQLYAQQTGRNLGIVAKQIQEATGYMIGFKEASSAAALSGTAGLATKDILRMTEVARSASVALGRDMTDSLDRLTRGLVKGEPEILDELGILIRLDKVYKDYADSLNISTSELTEFQKQQARTNAILGQGEEKFGAIGKSVGVNEFAKLQAAALDAVRELSTGIVSLFSPLASFLSSFKEALLLVFAFVAKNLATKVFPALEKLGVKFESLPNRFQNRLDASSKKLRVLGKLEARYNKKSLDATREMSKLQKMTGKMGLRSGSVLEQMFGLSEKGTLTAKQKQRFINAAKQGVTAAKQAISQNRDPGGSFIGMSEKQILAYENQLNKVVASQGQVVTGTKRMSLGFKSLGVAVREGFAKVAIRGLTLVQAGMARVTAVMGVLGKVASRLMTAFAVFTTVTFIADMIMGLSNTFTKASEAAGTFGDSVGSAVKSLRNTTIVTDPTLISGSFKKQLQSAEFKSNIAQQLNDSFNDAVKNIKIEVSSTADMFASVINGIKEAFGGGIKGAIIDGVVGGIEGLQALGNLNKDVLAKIAPFASEKFTEEKFVGYDDLGTAQFLTQTGTRQSEAAANRFKLGTATFEDFDLLKQALQSIERTEALKIMEQLAASTKVAAKEAKLLAANLKEVDMQAKATKDAFTDLGRDLVRKTDFDKMDIGLTGFIKSLKVLDDAQKAAALSDFLGKNAPKTLKALTVMQKRVDETRDKITSAKAAGKSTATLEETLTKQVGLLEFAKEEAADYVKKIGDIRGMVVGRMYGKDPAKARAEELQNQTKISQIKERIAVIDNTSFRNNERVVKLTQEAFDLEKQKLQTIISYRKFALGYDEKAIKTDQTILAVKEELELLDQKRNKAAAIHIKQLDMMEKITGRQASYTQRVQATAADKSISGASQSDISSIVDTMALTEINQMINELVKIENKFQANVEADKKIADYVAALKQKGAIISPELMTRLETAFKMYGETVRSLLGQAQTKLQEAAINEEYYAKTEFEISERKKLMEQMLTAQNEAERQQIKQAQLIDKYADIRLKTIEVEKAAMREMAEDFGKAISTISTSFENALQESFEGALTGVKPDKSFRETVGQGFLKAGTGMAANMVTKGIFGRSGLVGKGLESVFGAGFADMAIPQTELEVAQSQLGVLKEIRDELAGKPGGGNPALGFANALTDGLNDPLSAIIGPNGSVTTLMDSLTNSLTGNNGIFSSLTGMFSQGGMFGGIGSMLTGANNWLGSTFSPLDLFGFGGFFANGGIAKGGFRMYANGGIATQPHLGMVGEGKYNEAIVPLPDGKSIPVIGNTGGGNTNNVTVNVQVDSNGQAQAQTESNDQMGKELGHRISQAVQEEIMMQQRPGGLLSQYKN